MWWQAAHLRRYAQFRLGALVLAVGSIGLALASCGGASSGASSSSSSSGGAVAQASGASGSASASSTCAQPTVVKMQEWPGDIINIVPQVALAEGMFKAHCLNAEFVPINSGPGADAAVESGSVQFANGAPNTLMTAYAHGIDLRVVANMYKYQPWALVARKGLALPHATQGYPSVMKDLVGKKIGVTTLGGTAEAFARANFQSAGLNPNSATYVAIGPTPAEIAALEAGRVDAIEMFGLGPDIAQAVGAGRIIIDMRKPGDGPQAIQATDGAALSWGASGSFIKSHPQVVKEFAAANNEAISWIQDPANRSQVDKIIAAQVKLPSNVPNPAQTLDKIVELNAASLGSGVPQKAMAGWNAFLVKSGLLKQAIPYEEIAWPPAAELK